MARQKAYNYISKKDQEAIDALGGGEFTYVCQSVDMCEVIKIFVNEYASQTGNMFIFSLSSFSGKNNKTFKILGADLALDLAHFIYQNYEPIVMHITKGWNRKHRRELEQDIQEFINALGKE